MHKIQKHIGFLDLGSNVIIESIHVEFIENKFINDAFDESLFEQSQCDVDSYKISHFNITNKRNRDSSPLELRRSQRVKKGKQLSLDFISSQEIVFLVEGNRNKVCNKIHILLNVKDDPKTFQEAMSSRDEVFGKRQ